ncbi:hypothetical protein DN155_18765 [Salmonella enterica subsp. enterica serovar Afula]|uniref:Uncharacterized protein n=2 Tax=Salmonella enterica I TaxID=59201 RepID=A0A2C9P1X9_SALET|nr:hypothetical protein LFZ25_16325 [Salmonella enterica subsp. enterica serovar Macclesfield str. S-1643]EAA5485333.1 hypothetical protein [Salmonella enterica subsp. enterica serovar Kouka]EBS1109304.1 hypothetical protein [Salmonella enterica subsp. enterica serovar Eingedi]EBV2194313.1 hypothetical protein [Salmonella enterica subsp. enterica serovar Afula]ECD5051288.1 hypothetical protein [Salmonella enterica subsp. enterica serovar Everleigh]
MCILPDGGASTLSGLRICIVRRPGKRRATGHVAGSNLLGRRDSARATRRTCFVASGFPLA